VKEDLVTTLLPILARPLEREFNVFEVMHHGTHEKQLSNVFAWLLNSDETHKCGDAFLRIFLEEVNSRRGDDHEVAVGSFSVRQEVNTSGSEERMDIADLVLEDHDTVVVVENYCTSSGHGHAYDQYFNFGRRGGKKSVVVLLCENENRNEQVDGWENARVVTYAALVEKLFRYVDSRDKFRDSYPAQYSFISQMQRHFVKGKRMHDEELVRFIDALCQTGEARHFGTLKNEDAAINFGDHLREEAVRRFEESRELLRRLKQKLRDYGEGTLKPQMNAARNELNVGVVSARYQGTYEWTINFFSGGDNTSPLFQLKFGPSAWYANEKDRDRAVSERCVNPDYSYLFITRGERIQQSAVALREVANGLSQDDTRLRDEILELMSDGAD
jgi:hypothetical protein